jgi:hypothetical protein
MRGVKFDEKFLTQCAEGVKQGAGVLTAGDGCKNARARRKQMMGGVKLQNGVDQRGGHRGFPTVGILPGVPTVEQVYQRP